MKIQRQKIKTRTSRRTASKFRNDTPSVLVVSVLIGVGIISLVWMRNVLAQNPNTNTPSQLSSTTQAPAVSTTSNTTTPTTPTAQPVNLGDIAILDKLFNNSANSIFNGQPNQQNGYSLGDLFTLDKLFAPGGTLIRFNNTADSILGNQMILNKLFSSTAAGEPNSSGQSSGTNLGSLFNLDQLFAQTPAKTAVNNYQNTNGPGDMFMLRLFAEK